MRIITDIFAFCNQHVPQWNTISISGYHIREAGSTAVQEVAFTLANGIAYVQAAIDAGLDVDSFGERLSFFFNAQVSLKKLQNSGPLAECGHAMRGRFRRTPEPDAEISYSDRWLHGYQQPTTMWSGGIPGSVSSLGGTQSLHTNSRDEAFALPSTESVQIALRTQQIIGYETGAADTVDPLAGSYYVEALTNEIERRAFDYINKIDEMGGAVKAVECGFIEQEIQDSAYSFQKAVESGDQVIVG
jgi:methylmalonyl-CoA mutase N-terminal domain/subunit